jgi:hypothetical protein
MQPIDRKMTERLRDGRRRARRSFAISDVPPLQSGLRAMIDQVLEGMKTPPSRRYGCISA